MEEQKQNNEAAANILNSFIERGDAEVGDNGEVRVRGSIVPGQPGVQQNQPGSDDLRMPRNDDRRATMLLEPRQNNADPSHIQVDGIDDEDGME
jgi:hypothetical protein